MPTGPYADVTEADDPRTPGREVSISRGTFLGLRADVIAVISAVVVSIIVSRGLGPVDRGVFFLAFATATLLALIGDFGMSTAGIVFSANREVPPRRLHGIAIGFGVFVGLLTAFVLLPFDDFWTGEVLRGLDFTLLALICAGVPLLVYGQVMLATLTGLGKIPAISWMRIAQQIAIPAALVPAVLISHSPTWTFAAWLIVTVAFVLTIAVYSVGTGGPPELPDAATVRKVTSFGTRGYVGTISHHGFLRIDLFFLGAREGPRQVGLYSLSSVFAERIGLLGQAVYGASAAAVGSGEREEAARMTAQIVRVLMILVIPVAAVLAALAFPGIPLVFGDDFAEAALPFALLLPGTTCLTLWYPVSLFIVSNLERPGTASLVQGGALLASLPLYYAMIRSFDMTGAAIASSIVYAAVLAMGTVVFLRATEIRLSDLLPRRGDLGRMAGFARSALGRPGG